MKNIKNTKTSLEEATIKALYNELEDNKDYSNVEGLIDDVLVVTDPEINTEEYEEVIERAQEIIEDTPEGEIPFDEDFLNQFLLTCPICGTSFVSEQILDHGEACPICLKVPEAFLVRGKIKSEENVIEENGLDLQPDESEEEDTYVPEMDNEPELDEESELEKDVASLQMNQGNKLEESKTEGIECLNESTDEETDYIQRCLNAAKEKFGRDLTSEEIDLIKNIAPIMRPKNESVEEHNLSKDLFGDEATNRNIQRAKDFEKHLQYVKDIMAGKTVVDDKYNEEIDLQTAKKWLRDDYVYIKGLLSFSPEEIDEKLAQDLPEIFGNNLNKSAEIKEEAKLIETNEWDEDILTEAERLNFKSAGIQRAPEYDFSDDGSRFKGYICNGVPITYLKARGDVYLAIRVDYLNGLNYEEYRKLPSYKDCDKYNGVSENEVDLADVVEICKRIKAEYDEALNNRVEISDDEYKALTDKYLEKAKKEFEEAKSEIRSLDPEELLGAPDYKIKDLKNYLTSLKAYIKNWSWDVQSTKNQSSRRHQMQDDTKKYNNEVNWYLTEIKEIVAEIKNNNKTESLQENKESDIKTIMEIVNENKEMKEEEYSSKLGGDPKDFISDVENILKVLKSIDVFSFGSKLATEIVEEFISTCESQISMAKSRFLGESKLEETGEWDETDSEMTQWLEDMKIMAYDLANQIDGEVKSVEGFDKYQGPVAVIETPKHGDLEMWFDTEDYDYNTFIITLNDGYIKGSINDLAIILNQDEIPESEILHENNENN